MTLFRRQKTVCKANASPQRPGSEFAPRLRSRRQRRGVALLMVLGTLAIVTVMLTEFQDSVSAELGSSVAARDQVKAEYAAKSAVNLTRLLIAAEPTVRATPLGGILGGAQIPVWEYTDIILGAFNDASGGAVFEGISGMSLGEGRNLGMEGAGFEIVVVDEDSKINFNMAARADAFSQKRQEEQILALIEGVQYNEFFEDAQDEKGNPLDRVTTCSALVDWVDPNAERSTCNPRDTNAPTSTAPEDSYYQLLDLPYRRKNAALDSLDELHLVQGVTEDFWRRFIEPDPDDPKSRIVTIWGSGKVNVNSANAKTLLALVCHLADPNTPLCIDPVMQQKYLMTMQMFAGAMAGLPLFGSPDKFVEAIQGKGQFGTLLEGVGVTPVKPRSAKQMSEAVTTESQVFSIYATGYVDSGKRRTRSRIHAVVDMRGAPPPGTAEDFAKQQQWRNASSGSGGTSPPDLGLPEDATADALASALLPKAGGSILYYRVD